MRYDERKTNELTSLAIVDFNVKKETGRHQIKKNKTSIQLFSSYHWIDELRRS